ncbi:HNH endonuclease [Rhodobacter phage RcKickapoo]|nr:HNH endonuclease [Rhodobacter phage RcKickapoo]
MSLVQAIKASFRYDPVTGHVRRRIPSRQQRAGAIVGTPNGHGYLTTTIPGGFGNIPCHVIAWVILHGELPPVGMTIDHKDTDRQNNKADNLRLLSFKNNIQNQKKRITGTTSKYRGVSYRPRNKKYAARIRVNGKLMHLGLFRDEREAAIAWNTAALIHFGDHVLLNEV